MKFAKRGDRQTKFHEFDKETICFKKAGKTYNNFDFIQAANVDTDIKEVIKKYNCTVDEAAEFMKSKGGMEGIYGDFRQLQEQCKTLADVIQLKDKADELFYNLPTEVREKYQNNLEKFFDDLTNQKKTEFDDLTNQKKTEPEPQPVDKKSEGETK